VKYLLSALEDHLGFLPSGVHVPVVAAANSLAAALLAIQQGVGARKVPEDDFCNISIHQVWPIVFFISLALNVAFVVLAVIYVTRRKKNRKDNTPLVDYDIGDDL